MNRTLSALIISAAILTACTNDTTFTPGISFLTATPEILEESAIFRIIGQSFESADTVKIPVIFGGSAEKGVDYEVSAEYFSLRSGSPTDSIVVFTKQLSTGKNMTMSLQIPEGFAAGKYLESGFRLQDKYGLLSFAAQRGYIADTTKYTVALSDHAGAARALSKDTPISFALNTEKSTAVEGVDFEFIDTDTLVIQEGGSTVSFTIAPIKGALKEGQDRIVLNLIADKKFDVGKVPEMEIEIIRPEFKTLEGKWKIDTLVTDSLYFEKIWGSQCSGYSLVPEFSSSDAFEIAFDNASFSPSFRSGLKHYFTDDSQFGFGKEIEITDIEGNLKTLQLLSLDKTNRYFSETETSEDSLSFVGIHFMKEAETEADMLEFYFIDHTSKSFMPELESGMKYGTEKPVATAPGTYLMATFRKR